MCFSLRQFKAAREDGDDGTQLHVTGTQDLLGGKQATAAASGLEDLQEAHMGSIAHGVVHGIRHGVAHMAS